MLDLEQRGKLGFSLIPKWTTFRYICIYIYAYMIHKWTTNLLLCFPDSPSRGWRWGHSNSHKTKCEIISIPCVRSVTKVFWQKQRSIWKFHHCIMFADKSTGWSLLSGKYFPFWGVHCPSCNYGRLTSSAFRGRILTNRDPHILVIFFLTSSIGHLSPLERKASEAHLQDKGAATLQIVKFFTLMSGAELPALKRRWLL